jgi:hypothetical protein
MATQPPIKTTLEDIDALAAYLRNKVGWSDVEDVKKRIAAKHADNRKIEAMRYVGLLERDGSNIKLSDAGRKYAGAADDGAKALILRAGLRKVLLYDATLEWLFHNGLEVASKTDIANYWHDNLSDESAQTTGAALTDAAVFFGRIVGAAGLGTFVAAGHGRDTEIRIDRTALTEYVSSQPEAEQPGATPGVTEAPIQPTRAAPQARVSVGALSPSPVLNINVEIHIAADAKASTVEEIFKNMRKYLYEEPEAPNGG